MTPLTSNPITKTDIVWLALMLATIITTWTLSGSFLSTQLATGLTLFIAALKIRFVLIHFMELNRTPLSVRMAFEAWPWCLAGGIYWFYLQPGLAPA